MGEGYTGGEFTGYLKAGIISGGRNVFVLNYETEIQNIRTNSVNVVPTKSYIA